MRALFVVFDRGYTDFTWFNWLNSKEIYFVTRLKANTKYRVISRHPVNKEQGITSDQTLILTGPKADTCPMGIALK
ncbi:MAG: transposase [Gammaproteobacteria bacterium]|nr:transposase [Gammaproteobacteria bacterium]